MEDINSKLDELFVRYENAMRSDGYFGFRLAMWVYGINNYDGNYVSMDEEYKKDNR